MITDTSKFHGSFFAILFDEIARPLSVERLYEYGSGFYLLAGAVPILLKHSTQRKGPWTFNFTRSHQEMQKALFKSYSECFTAMICGNDGIAGLSMSEFRKVLDEDFGEQEWITIRRRLKTMYQIKGKDGELDGRIGRRSIFEKLSHTLEGIA